MKKKFLMGISAATCALVVGALISTANSPVRSDAAIIKDGAAHYEDTFASYDDSKWTRIGDAEASMYQMVDESVVEIPGVSLTGYNANNGQMGWLRTEQMISLSDGKSLVVDVQGSNWTAGMIAFHGLRNTDVDLGAALGVGFSDLGQSAGVGGIETLTAWTGLGASNFHSQTKFRFVLNPDGTGRVDGLLLDNTPISADGCPGTAFTGMPFVQKGYWGLQGFNGFAADISRITIGQANADGSGYELLFVSNLVKDHANMADHGNVRWGSQTTTFKDIKIQSEGYVNLKGYNYNDGWFTSKSPVSIDDGKVFYYEVSMKDWSGDLGFTGVESAYAWPNFFELTTATNMISNNIGGATVVFPVTNSGWHNIIPGSIPNEITVRLAIASDGTGKFGLVNEDGTWMYNDTLAYVADLTGMHYATSGYVGFYGNGGSLDTKFTSFTVGQADDLEMTNKEVVRSEDYRYVTPELFGEKFAGSSSSVTVTAAVYGKEVHEMQLHSPVAGSALVYKANAIDEGNGKLGEASLTITPNKFAPGAAVGLAFGANEENPAGQVNVLVKCAATGITLNDAELSITELGQPVTLHAVVYGDKIVANVGEVEVEVNTTNVVGNVAIVGESLADTVDAKLNSFVFDKYQEIDRNGRNINITSFTEENLDWLYHRVDDDGLGTIDVVDGKAVIRGKDGVYIGTKESYTNFELEADFEYFYDEEEEMIVSVWAGLCFGKEVDYAGCAWAGDTNAPFIYFQNMVIDYMNMPIPSGTRGWTSTENNPMQEGNNHVKVRAVDGHVEMWFNHGDNEPVKYLDVYDMNTTGRIAFACTNGSNYSISSFKVTNLDHEVNVNPTDTTETKEYSVEQGSTVEGQISGTSAYNGNIKYKVVENGLDGLGQLTIDANGKVTFVANDNAAAGTYEVKYAIVDDNLVTEGTLTITITAKQGGGEETSEIPSEEPSETPSVTPSENPSQEPTSEGQPEEPAKKGCGGSILAVSGVVALISLCGACFAISKKKEH